MEASDISAWIHMHLLILRMSTVHIIDKREQATAIKAYKTQTSQLRASKITPFFSIDFQVQLLDPALSGASTFKTRRTGFITKDAGDEKQ